MIPAISSGNNPAATGNALPNAYLKFFSLMSVNKNSPAPASPNSIPSRNTDAVVARTDTSAVSASIIADLFSPLKTSYSQVSARGTQIFPKTALPCHVLV